MIMSKVPESSILSIYHFIHYDYIKIQSTAWALVSVNKRMCETYKNARKGRNFVIIFVLQKGKTWCGQPEKEF